jgi:hypothetical protein
MSKVGKEAVHDGPVAAGFLCATAIELAGIGMRDRFYWFHRRVLRSLYPNVRSV